MVALVPFHPAYGALHGSLVAHEIDAIESIIACLEEATHRVVEVEHP